MFFSLLDIQWILRWRSQAFTVYLCNMAILAIRQFEALERAAELPFIVPHMASPCSVTLLPKFFLIFIFPAAPSGPSPVFMGVCLLSEQRRLALVAELLVNCPSPKT
jgi:hypothetical protein